jgi:hypothetical protein
MLASVGALASLKQVLYHRRRDRSSALLLFEQCQSFILMLDFFGIVLEPGKACAGRFVFDQLQLFHSVAVERVCIFPGLYFTSVCFGALARVRTPASAFCALLARS